MRHFLSLISSCTQSPCPCSNPLLTRTSTGDTQTQFCLSFCGVSGSWCTQDLFEPSEHLWWVWGLILNMSSPLLPSCWGFSFTLGREVSPQCHSSALQLPLQCPPSCWGFSAPGRVASPHSHSSTYCPDVASLPLDVGYLLTVTPAPMVNL